MIEMHMQKECQRCKGTGTIAATKRGTVALLCSCPAGRTIASPPIFKVRSVVFRG